MRVVIEAFPAEESRQLARAFLNNPADIPCPKCDLEIVGERSIEVVYTFDSAAFHNRRIVHTYPDGAYVVVLYCHRCGRVCWLDIEDEIEHCAVLASL